MSSQPQALAVTAAHSLDYEIHDATDRAAWLARREHDVTASAAAGLLSASPYGSPYQLFMQKSGAASPIAETPAMRRGTLLEAVHAEMIAAERPEWSIERGTIYIRDPAARLGATPDVFALRPDLAGHGIIQLKSVSPDAFRKSWRIEGTHEAEPPAYVQIQAMLEAEMAGAAWAMVSAMVIGNGVDLHLFEVELRPKIISRLRAETAEFWRRVAACEPYDPDYLADSRFILDQWRPGAAPQVDLTENARAIELMDERRALKDAEKAGTAAAKARSIIDAELLHLLGNASVARIGAETLTARRQVRKPYAVAASEFTVINVKNESAIASKEAV